MKWALYLRKHVISMILEGPYATYLLPYNGAFFDQSMS
jgi:hypothetical protein